MDSTRVTEDKNVLRFGINYELTSSTFLRASWGQGFRFPSIAEKYIKTDVGFPVKPNPDLVAERGWSAEFGIKQGFKIGSKWLGYADFSIFHQDYEEMIEFIFDFSDINDIGFSATNIGSTQIQGFEFSLAGEGKIGPVGISILGGYQYIDPRFKEWDLSGKELQILSYQDGTVGQQNAFLSSSEDNILKYRYRHNTKMDIEMEYKGLRFGVAYNYFSNTEAIDFIFNGLIPGIDSFRQDHKDYSLLDLRLSYNLDQRMNFGCIFYNILNTEYAVRPAILEAPRNITFKLTYKI